MIGRYKTTRSYLFVNSRTLFSPIQTMRNVQFSFFQLLTTSPTRCSCLMPVQYNPESQSSFPTDSTWLPTPFEHKITTLSDDLHHLCHVYYKRFLLYLIRMRYLTKLLCSGKRILRKRRQTATPAVTVYARIKSVVEARWISALANTSRQHYRWTI